ncbi:MAG: ATP-binding cassette domain-containing protein [Thermodesulfobacteriota bacterium]|nr:ATP-binding cassette domain-containing protein [Thermodesulfobacteriota bacterium]
MNNKSLRDITGVVPQKIDIFTGNVIENIAVGDFSPDMKKIDDICEKIGINDFVARLSNGYQTYLGEKGANLSEGEKQRIAIARALYKSPEVLMMGETTSSLDSASEKYVQHAILSLRKSGKTIIIIAHRLSTIMNADKIIVLKEGKTVKGGMHEELLLAKGVYYTL